MGWSALCLLCSNFQDLLPLSNYDTRKRFCYSTRDIQLGRSLAEYQENPGWTAGSLSERKQG